ncbi:cytochrome b [Motilimonas pumila]|uniref:Cytochrome b n=1 Tax=Motilimonas pumila TaxID=2303987 RepID=A0A418YFE6_9GAMM|nr:cytochrome b [Motilimonas pumila]RJG48095.1 cytochrome b [Motilimonas pumila]
MAASLSKQTVLLHWLTALLFIGVLGLGLYMVDLPKSPDKFELYGIHKSVGFIVLLIAIVRLSWRMFEGPVNSISPLPRYQEILAKSIHHLLLLGTLLMPISGVLMSIGGGRAVEVFGYEIVAAGDKIEWLGSISHSVHGIAADIIIVALVLHIVGALKHQWIDKDGTVSRMLGKKV